MSQLEIHAQIHAQILNEIDFWLGIEPSAVSAATYGTICERIMSVDGVASVGIHCDKEPGAVQANVELADGDVFTVTITDADYSDDDNGFLSARIDVLETRIATVDARISSVVAELEFRIANLETARRCQ